jgi:hypothetical protein
MVGARSHRRVGLHLAPLDAGRVTRDRLALLERAIEQVKELLPLLDDGQERRLF